MTMLTGTRWHLSSQLADLEDHGIYIMREVAATFERPALLFSGGKDSCVLLRLAEKAFRPGKFPFPVVHVDTGHNFPEVIEFRDRRVAELGERLVVASVQASIDAGRVADPGPTGSRNRLQSTTLLDAIAEHQFDCLIGGARRDEDKARAKERVLSFRDAFGQWEPRNQRPELWRLYNGRVRTGEHVRAFPISDWTELDVWRYIAADGVELPSLYYSHKREVVERQGMLVATGPWTPPGPDEEPVPRDGALPHGRRHDVHRRGAVRGRHARGDRRRDGGQPRHRAGRHPGRRPLLRDGHGGPQARGLLLASD